MGPMGTFIEGAEPVWDKEQIVYAELNRDDLVEARVSYCQSSTGKNVFSDKVQMDFDAVGSFSRPDIL